MTWARVGMKCVCVDDDEDSYTPGPGEWTPLVRGQLYTIRWVGTSPFPGHPVGLAVRLYEIVRPLVFGVEGVYRLDRFRPLVTRSQEDDLQHFLPLLNSKEDALQ